MTNMWEKVMLVVRKANDGDSKDIFDWRNDALTRQMSHNTDYIEWNEHSNWFSSSLTSENRLLIMCEKKDTLEKIAIVRFDVDEGRALVSINLNPNKRGKGLAKVCLTNSIDYFSKYFSDINKLVAEIKKENITSEKTFLGIGFEKYNVESEVCFYEKLLVISKNGN
jgi:RimJ/RimL family protein N-acetyltransferase